MGKKVRFQALTGSLLKPLLRYTQRLQIFVNPVSDPKGYKLAKQWHQMGTLAQPQFKLPSINPIIETLNAPWWRITNHRLRI